MAGFGVWGHFTLPETPMAVHYNIQGQADGFAPRDQALLMLPGLAFCLHLGLFFVLPMIARNGELMSRSSAPYGAICFATIALLATLHIAMVLSASGVPVSPVT